MPDIYPWSEDNIAIASQIPAIAANHFAGFTGSGSWSRAAEGRIGKRSNGNLPPAHLLIAKVTERAHWLGVPPAGQAIPLAEQRKGECPFFLGLSSFLVLVKNSGGCHLVLLIRAL